MKREKERQKQDKAKDKAAKRELRKAEKADRPAREPGDEDPQIAGIVPGPQPVIYDDRPGDRGYTPR